MTVFIHDFVHIHLPYSAVRDRLAGGDPSWIGGIADDAYAEGEDLRLHIGPRRGKPLTKATRVHFGTPYQCQDGVVIPMSWLATGTPGLFPAMEADLDVAPIGDDLTQLTLSGMYEPPMGAVGKAMDGLLMHRVAEASVRSFLQRIASSLQAASALSAGYPPGGGDAAVAHGA